MCDLGTGLVASDAARSRRSSLQGLDDCDGASSERRSRILPLAASDDPYCGSVTPTARRPNASCVWSVRLRRICGAGGALPCGHDLVDSVPLLFAQARPPPPNTRCGSRRPRGRSSSRSIATGRRTAPIGSTSCDVGLLRRGARSSASARGRGPVRDRRRPEGRAGVADEDDPRRSLQGRLEQARHRRVRLQGPERPDDAGLHQPEGQLRDARSGTVRRLRRGVEGMDVADALYAEYGEGPAAGFARGSRIRCSRAGTPT